MRMKGFAVFILSAVLLTLWIEGSVWAQEAQQILTMEESIRIAMERSLTIHSDVVGIEGSEFRRKEAITNFLPLWQGQYNYTLYNSPVTITLPFATASPGIARNVFTFGTTVTQPVFTGGLNLSTYQKARIGVDISKMTLDTAKRDLVLQVRTGYFNILTTQKLLEVARQQVKQFEAQLEVSRNYFDVGIVAKNDVLQAEVSLANAVQGQISAENNVFLAKSSFNNLLRRDINTPFDVVDILEYVPFPLSFENSLDEALRRRPEIKNAQLNIDQAKEGVRTARAGFFPTISLIGAYNKVGEELFLSGAYLNKERWSMQALASVTLWNWGNTAFQVGENKVKVTQAEDAKTQLAESITLEVKNDFLNMKVSEKNLDVSRKAIEQAEENLRMTEERYKYQVATSTDLVVAVTLLTQAKTNYYASLGAFNISKVQLERAMGRMYP